MFRLTQGHKAMLILLPYNKLEINSLKELHSWNNSLPQMRIIFNNLTKKRILKLLF
jgi:hypothetical protein